MTSMDHHFGATGIVRNPRAVREADPLPRLLTQLLDRAGQPATVERAVSRPWASALFEGRRHIIGLRITGEDFPDRGHAFLSGLDEAEWTLPEHFVADIDMDECTIRDDHLWLELFVLTIRDW